MSRCKDKSCPNNKICNPASGRCVQKKGKIGMELLEQNKKSSPSRKLSRNKKDRSSSVKNYLFFEYGAEITPYIHRYSNMKKIGQGAFGAVYIGIKDNGKKEIVKIQIF